MQSSRISETDFILREDGSAFHIGLKPNQIPPLIITVGDPERVGEVSKNFNRIDFKISRREFVSHLGSINSKDVLVISTGIGADNVEIVLTELDGLVNIDFKTRLPKTTLQKLSIIRIGTSGALQPDIEVGSFIASSTAIGLDNLLSFYAFPQSDEETSITREIKATIGLLNQLYMASASPSLLKKFTSDFIEGNTLTCPGFYAPQGRAIRMPVINPNLLENLISFRKGSFNLHNFEMETAAYYAFARMMQHEVLSLNAILANRALKKFAQNPNAIVNNLISEVLERI